MSIELKSIGKKVELQPRTRKITRAVSQCLMQGVTMESHTDEYGKVSVIQSPIPLNNGTLSEELGIRLLFGLTEEEMDELSDEDFDLLRDEIEKADAQKKTLEPKSSPESLPT